MEEDAEQPDRKTLLGLVLAQRYPDDYHAFISVSQHVDAARSQPLARQWLEDRIREEGNERDLEALEELGPAPYRNHESFVDFVHMVDAYGGDFDVGMAKMGWVALTAPHFTVWELRSWLRGANRGSGPMWDDPDCQYFDAFEDVPRLEVPVYFLNGAHDWNTPLTVTRSYYEALEAPAGKELVVFENSAHTPFLAEPEKFNAVVVRVKRETGQEGDAGGRSGEGDSL